MPPPRHLIVVHVAVVVIRVYELQVVDGLGYSIFFATGQWRTLAPAASPQTTSTQSSFLLQSIISQSSRRSSFKKASLIQSYIFAGLQARSSRINVAIDQKFTTRRQTQTQTRILAIRQPNLNHAYSSGQSIAVPRMLSLSCPILHANKLFKTDRNPYYNRAVSD